MHHEVRLRAGFLDRINGDDVIVADGRLRLGLAREALAGGGVGRQLRRHHLDGHNAVQLFIEGPQHNAHTAAADDFLDFIMAQASQRRRFLRRGQKLHRRVIVGATRCFRFRAA